MPVILHDSFRPYKWGTMFKNWPFENVYMDNHAYHAFNVADIASESSEDDRQKLYVHEKIACSYKSQLHFQTCNVVPVFVGEFSIAIDNCMPHLDARYADYGQCRDIASRLESPWWVRHIKSFAMRQIATAERELGWSFWTYKLDTIVEATEPSSYFWSFRLAAKKGFVDKSFYGRKDACLFAPTADYQLGDGANNLGSTHHKKNSSKTNLRPLPAEIEKPSEDAHPVNSEEPDDVIFTPPNDSATKSDIIENPIVPSDVLTPSTPTSPFNTLSNYSLAIILIFFIGAIATIANQRLRETVSSVGGYSAVTQNQNTNLGTQNERSHQQSYQMA
jgi:hypothetical protein